MMKEKKKIILLKKKSTVMTKDNKHKVSRRNADFSGLNISIIDYDNDLRKSIVSYSHHSSFSKNNFNSVHNMNSVLKEKDSVVHDSKVDQERSNNSKEIKNYNSLFYKLLKKYDYHQLDFNSKYIDQKANNRLNYLFLSSK